MPRTTITLSPAIAEHTAYAHMAEQHAVSRWIRETLDQAFFGALQSLSRLRQTGWTHTELRAACDALNGVWLRDHYSRQGIALELHDWYRLSGGWDDLDPDEWAARIEGLDEQSAEDLAEVVTDFWRGGPTSQWIMSSALDALSAVEAVRDHFGDAWNDGLLTPRRRRTDDGWVITVKSSVVGEPSEERDFLVSDDGTVKPL